ncbi:MAG: thioredoxin family protein [Anaerolineae bacterium]
MIERSIMVLVFLVLGFAIFALLRHMHVRKASVNSGYDPVLNDMRPGVPAIVYFTTPGCVPCVTQQQPALARLQSELQEGIQILKIDAVEYSDVADRWGVFSAPTTFIVDGNRQVRNVNYGVADLHTLMKQLDSVRITVEIPKVTSQAA